MIRKGFVILVIPLLVISACRDEFMPDVEKYDNLLVVDGMITNEPSPYTIKLSRTSNVNKPDYNPLQGCNVELHQESGPAEVLKEEEPGVYKTDSGGIRGQVGKSYKLEINTPDGEHYESDFITMQPPEAIDTVEAELQFRESNKYPRPLGGYQFYLSTELVEEEDANFLWKFEETYQYHSEFHIHMIYRGMGIENFYNRDSLYTCWKTQDVPQIFVGSTKGLTISKISHEPIHYISTENKRLQVRYSLMVKQYSINSQAYSHWKAIKEQVAGDDFLFSSQPYQINGNVYNAGNPGETVLGFFTVGSVSKKRFFFDRPDAEFFYSKCIPNPNLMALAYTPPEEYPVYLTYTNEGIAFASDYCFDCTLWGGKLEKPDFWREKDN